MMNQLIRISQRYISLTILALVGCATTPPVAPPETPRTPPQPPVVSVPSKPTPPKPVPEATTESVKPVAPAEPGAIYTKVSWRDLPGWTMDDPAEAWVALLRSCGVLIKRDENW